jgi:asparagine synthetase B (glutamine-hydrolysing)
VADLTSNPALNHTITSIAVMCGIYCSLSRHGHIVPDAKTQQLLQNRGPDSVGQHQARIDAASSSQLHATFLSTVLSLRGQSIVAQPLHDAATGSVLCWNGEAWSIRGEAVAGNDSLAVFDKLLAACLDSIAAVVDMLSSIKGPYAFVFYDARHKLVYYGRDCLGRRSLLRKSAPDGTLILSSVCDNADGGTWAEVEADGIYITNLTPSLLTSTTHLPHRTAGDSIAVSLVGSPHPDVCANQARLCHSRP